MLHRALIVAVLLVLLLGAWYLTPAVLQASCSQDTMEGRSRGSAVDGPLCPDDGVLQEGRDHVVCVYPDRVVKVVRSCSSSSGRQQILDDHLHYRYAEWNARHTAAMYGHLAILLVPFAHEGKQWSYRNSRAVPWPKLSEGLAALDRTAQADGMLVTDLSPDNFLVENGTGIIVDFDLHLAWGRDAFAPVLWLGCAGCSPSRKAWLNQPTWCARINFCGFGGPHVRIAPYKNIYGNADSLRSIHAALWSGLPELDAASSEDMQHGDLTAIALALLLLGVLLLGVACTISLVRLCCTLRGYSGVSMLHPEE